MSESNTKGSEYSDAGKVVRNLVFMYVAEEKKLAAGDPNTHMLILAGMEKSIVEGLKTLDKPHRPEHVRLLIAGCRKAQEGK